MGQCGAQRDAAGSDRGRLPPQGRAAARPDPAPPGRRHRRGALDDQWAYLRGGIGRAARASARRPTSPRRGGGRQGSLHAASWLPPPAARRPPRPLHTASTPPALLADAAATPPAFSLEASVLKAITSGLFDSDADACESDSCGAVDLLTRGEPPCVRRVTRRLVVARPRRAAAPADSSSASDASAATPACAAPQSPPCGGDVSSLARSASPPPSAASAPPPTPKRLKALRGDWWAVAAPPVDDPDVLALAPPRDEPPTPLSLPSVSLAGLLPDQVAAALAPPPVGAGPLGLALDAAALVAELGGCGR